MAFGSLWRNSDASFIIAWPRTGRKGSHSSVKAMSNSEAVWGGFAALFNEVSSFPANHKKIDQGILTLGQKITFFELENILKFLSPATHVLGSAFRLICIQTCCRFSSIYFMVSEWRRSTSVALITTLTTLNRILSTCLFPWFIYLFFWITFLLLLRWCSELNWFSQNTMLQYINYIYTSSQNIMC